MKTKIENILNETLPKSAFRYVGERNFMGETSLIIAFAANDYNINGVEGQKPQIVSLMLHLKDLDLHPQCFGGNGGQFIYRKPNLNDAKEKYLAMKNVKIPFKHPKQEEKFVLSAVKRFAENWLLALKENKDVLMYQQYVNYNELLG